MPPDCCPDELNFCPLTSADTEALMRLVRDTFGEAYFTDRAVMHWMHFENPQGPSIAMGAFHDDKLIGSSCLVPGQFYIHGEIHRLALSVSSITRKEYQAVLFRGPQGFETVFSRLCRLCSEQAESQGLAGEFAFPNEASYRGFVNHLDFVDIGELEIRISPYRLAEMLGVVSKSPAWLRHIVVSLPQIGVSMWHNSRRRGLPGFEIHVGSDFDSRYDALSRKVARHFGIMQNRDSVFLKWRLGGHPRLNYTVLEAVQGSELVAYVAFTEHCWPERSETTIPVGFIVDYQAEPTEAGTSVLRALLSEAGRRMRNAKMAMATVIHAHHPAYRDAFAKAGFFVPPARAKPRPFHCVLRAHQQVLQCSEAQELGSWMLTMVDDDII